jgi:N-acylneuraminate cytidylyltransferase
MLAGAPLTAVIPVRGGSKGIPGKNLLRFGGLTLLERAIQLAKASPLVDRVLVTTDSPEMQEVAVRHGAAMPSLRPARLASDTATTADAVLHLIATCGLISGNLLLLQVTSPLRTSADLARFLAAYAASGAPAAASVVKHEEPRPEKLKRIVDGRVVSYLEASYEGPRQVLPQPYALNGAFYVIGVSTLMKEKRFLPEGTLAFEMPASRSANLDSPEDLDIFRAMLETGRWTLEELG